MYILLKITQYTAIIVNKAGNNTDYTLNYNSYTSFNHAKPRPIHHVHVLSAWQDHTNLCILF